VPISEVGRHAEALGRLPGALLDRVGDGHQSDLFARVGLAQVRQDAALRQAAAAY